MGKLEKHHDKKESRHHKIREPSWQIREPSLLNKRIVIGEKEKHEEHMRDEKVSMKRT